MKTICLLVPLVLFAVSAAQADSGVLVDHVPGGADQAIVIAVVKQSLINRGWTVDSVVDKTVAASLNHSNSDAKLRITLSNGQLLYEGSAINMTRTVGPGQPGIRREGNVPTNWIKNLRRDIAIVLSTIPEAR